jgi:Tfp pilus assembly protein PilF
MAVDDFTKAIEIDNQFAAAYFNRALAYILVNKMEEACKDLDVAIALKVERAKTLKQMYCR